jgi:hypothetical protein
MKNAIQRLRFAVLAAASLALLATAVSTSQAQVTLSQVTNGLVSWYPLDFVVTNTDGTTITTFDYLGARDMILFNMNGANVLTSTRPSQNSSSVSNCFNFDQQASGVGTTIMYYDSKGQNALDGSGDFLPSSAPQIPASAVTRISVSSANAPTEVLPEPPPFGSSAPTAGAALTRTRAHTFCFETTRAAAVSNLTVMPLPKH